jgi:hypothetical protein
MKNLSGTGIYIRIFPSFKTENQPSEWFFSFVGGSETSTTERKIFRVSR